MGHILLSHGLVSEAYRIQLLLFRTEIDFSQNVDRLRLYFS